ncbi:hypothetical protein CTA2_8055 [Colletotrichum tanaceti]|uniref:Uncharacterized protein n=1 Tax=Colletotrichum tanaceti TaxID=1306861 RepID=A0A4V6DGY1_9PEZI|nr:hypothetical protein CTA2_8055 [Colletotrichum tanaceti]TKW54456.1 hypothetical protein CTA1_10764 [Colletotrichum tanaceti]
MDTCDTMADNDIRNGRSARHQDFLLGFAPPATDSANATGIECTMALIRSINRMLPDEDRDANLDERVSEESRNPLMRQAWQGADHLQQEWSLADKTELVRKLGFSNVEDATFEQIATHPLMDSTLWARSDHLLSLRLIGRLDSSEWELAEDDTDEDHARRSLVRIQHQAGSGPINLTAEIQQIFDHVEILPDGSGRSFLARPPVYARILYTPAEDDVSDNLEALQVIHIRDTGEQENPIDDGVDRMLWRYVLVAAVRLRSRPDDHDKIRLFTSDGADISWTVAGAYADCDWHVGAPGHSYFLLYAHSNYPTKKFSHDERMDICKNTMYSDLMLEGWETPSMFEVAVEMMRSALANPDRTAGIADDLFAPKPWELQNPAPTVPQMPQPLVERSSLSSSPTRVRARYKTGPQAYVSPRETSQKSNSGPMAYGGEYYSRMPQWGGWAKGPQ